MAEPRAFEQVPLSRASLDLNRQIIERYGNNPDVLDSLEIRIKRCRHEGSARQGFVLCAYPPGADGDSERLIGSMLWAYFGDLPEAAEGAQ